MQHAIKMVPVWQLKQGDMVDLQGDRYADPKGKLVAFQYEYATVAFVRQETPDCTLIGIEGVDWFGFPTHHEVPLVSDALEAA